MIEHPGIILHDDFFLPLNISISRFSARVGIAQPLVSLLLKGYTPITPEIASALSKFFPETTQDQWLKMQLMYDASRVRV